MKCLFLILFASMGRADEAPLNFNQALDAMVQRELNLKIKESELRTADNNKSAAAFKFLPSVSATATRGSAGEPTYKYDRWALSSSVNVFRFGADVAHYQAADWQNQAALFDLDNEKIQRERLAASLVFDYIAAKKELDVRRVVLKSQQTYRDIAEARYRKGLLSQQDFEKVSIDLSNTESAFHDKEIDTETARRRLIEGLGHDRIQIEWPWLENLKSSKIEKSKLKEVIESHPSLKAQKSLLESAEATSKQGFRSMLPSLDLTASYGEIKYENSASTKEWTTGLTLTAPLFSRLDDYSTYRNNAESRLREELRLESLRRDLEKQIAGLWQSIDVTIQTAQNREKTLFVSRRLFEANLQRFQVGRVTVNELNEDQRRLSDAETLAISGWRNAHETMAQWCYLKAQKIRQCF